MGAWEFEGFETWRLDDVDDFVFEEDDLERCLLGVQSGSSPGLSGLRIDWLKRCWAGKSSGFRASLLRLVTRIAHGKVPTEACHLMRASLLIALEKPGGGVRPIAITDVTRRLASKLIMTKLPDKAEKPPVRRVDQDVEISIFEIY